MRKLILVFVGLIACLAISCKKKYTSDFIAPYKDVQYTMVDSLKLNIKEIDFQNASVNKVYFTGSVDKKTSLRITIKGLTSMAEKNLTRSNATSLDSISWDGSQDSLYYFREGEYCAITFSTVDDAKNNEVTRNLNDRGDIVSSGVVLDRDTILIKKRKAVPANQFEIFPQYPVSGGAASSGFIYVAAYDVEGSASREGIEASPEVLGGAGGKTVLFVSENRNWLLFDPYKKPIRGTFGDRFFIMRGTDMYSKVTPFDFPDYYVGRFMSPDLMHTPVGGTNRRAYGGTGINITAKFASYSADQVYFNVFVYGDGGGSQINYTVKELENPNGGDFDDQNDEAYQYPIKLNFRGWKLFSIPYSKFVYTRQKIKSSGKEYDGKYANHIKEPSKVVHVQFGLIAPKKGATGQFIIDNPVISWGGPLQY